jgi:hypothetical protein
MKDFFAFRRMLAPWIIRIGFIIGLLTLMTVGLYDIFNPHLSATLGLFIIIVGPVLLRLLLEMFIVAFALNESLTDIRNQLKKNVSTENSSH